MLMVLLILTIGSLTLQGMSLQQHGQFVQTSLEKRALSESASADSLLEWGRGETWSMEQDVQCLSHADIEGRLCLRRFADETVLLIAQSGRQIRWQTGRVARSALTFDSNGWSDFCPRKEAAQCLLP